MSFYRDGQGRTFDADGNCWGPDGAYLGRMPPQGMFGQGVGWGAPPGWEQVGLYPQIGAYPEIGSFQPVQTADQPLRDAQPQRADRLQPLGLGNTTITKAGTVVTVRVRPQRLFRVVRMALQGDADASLLINDVRIGNVSQAVGSGAQSAACYGRDAVLPDLTWDTAQPGIDIEIDVINIDAAADHSLRGQLLGYAVRPV